MYQAIEATCHQGTICPVEPTQFEENEHLIILRLPRVLARPAAPAQRARGAMKGMLASVDEFIANKAAEIALEHKP